MSTNNRLDIGRFMDRVRSTASAAMEETGQEADDAMRESISEAYPPASSPGEPPHRRTGALYEGAQSTVVEDEGGVEFQQGSSREGSDPNVPGYLEHGTAKMQPRPFVKPIAEEFGPKIEENVNNALRAEFAR